MVARTVPGAGAGARHRPSTGVSVAAVELGRRTTRRLEIPVRLEQPVPLYLEWAGQTSSRRSAPGRSGGRRRRSRSHTAARFLQELAGLGDKVGVVADLAGALVGGERLAGRAGMDRVEPLPRSRCLTRSRAHRARPPRSERERVVRLRRGCRHRRRRTRPGGSPSLRRRRRRTDRGVAASLLCHVGPQVPQPVDQIRRLLLRQRVA